MSGDEPVFEEEIVEEILPVEEPVMEEEEAIPDITEEPDPFVEELAAKLAAGLTGGEPALEEDLGPVEEETPLTKEEQRLELYGTLAESMPLVQEVTERFITFREALDEIVYELGTPQEESEGIRQFSEYFMALSFLTGETAMDGDGMMDVITYKVGNTIQGLINKITYIGGGGSAISLGVGLVLQKKNQELALILQAIGAGGLTTTGAFRGYFGINQFFNKRAANKQFAPLYEIADTLDAEVAELYRTEE